MKKIKILIVDDELPIREWLKHAFTSLDREIEIVDVCKDGREALQAYKKYEPDICFADIKMPNMNGIDLLQAIEAYDREAHVIMLTSHDDFELARKSLKYGASEYILKNEINPETLLDIVDNYAQRKEEVITSKFTIDDNVSLKSAFGGVKNEVSDIIDDIGKLNNNQFVLMSHLQSDADLSIFINLAYKIDGIESGRIYRYDRDKIVYVVQLVHSNSHMELYNHILALAKEIEGLTKSPVGTSEVLNENIYFKDAIQSCLMALGMSYYDTRPNCMYTSYEALTRDTLDGLVNRRNQIIELINMMSFDKAKIALDDFF